MWDRDEGRAGGGDRGGPIVPIYLNFWSDSLGPLFLFCSGECHHVNIWSLDKALSLSGPPAGWWGLKGCTENSEFWVVSVR